MKESKAMIDKMKKNKGFTLIELLAVIVILAIIALIAVPVVMNIIGKANKAAFKDSAYGIINAGEYFYTDKLLEAQGMVKDKTFTFPNDIEGLEIKGSKPSEGYVTVNKKGQVEMAISNGKYCVTKGFEDEDVTINDGNCKLSNEEETNEVYYNPNEAELCTKKEWENNVDKNGKSGCMRWYIYGEEGNKQKLILDHNIVNQIAWIAEKDYEDNDICGSYSYTGEAYTCNDQGPITLIARLGEETKNWKVTADIITYEEVANLLPYYQNLSDSDKKLFLNPTEENTSVIDAYLGEIRTAWTNVCEHDQSLCESYVEATNAKNEYLRENYGKLFLPKYMYLDMMDTCEDAIWESNGSPFVRCSTYGYWTKTGDSLDSQSALYVNSSGHVFSLYYLVSNDESNGLRPVIKIAK